MSEQIDVLIIGSGMSGLVAARELTRAGRDVLVIDKGRGVGGRMATRRSDDATYDHGAQFISARSPEFVSMISEWTDAGVATLWSNGFADGLAGDGSLLTTAADGSRTPHMPARDGHPRYRGVPGMTSIPKHLAEGLRIRTSVKAMAIAATDEGSTVTLEDGSTIAAASTVLTAPVPQSLVLLTEGGTVIGADARSELERIKYAPCLVLLGISHERVALPDPGVLRFPGKDLEWIADNSRKGISGRENALTIHMGHEFSANHYDASDEEIFAGINAALRGQLEEEIGWDEWQVKKWRYSRPLSPLDVGCWTRGLPGSLILAGDAFAGARVEGAALSGLAAVRELQ